MHPLRMLKGDCARQDFEKVTMKIKENYEII
jgi:hypothetical protein